MTNILKISIVPRYSETDQGGVVHHSICPVWFEMGRTELLRTNGFIYKDLEKKGIGFVVTHLNIKYHRPAFYDEKLQLTTTCTKTTTARIEHSYQLKRTTTGLLLVEGNSTLACIDEAGKVRRIPDFMRQNSKLEVKVP